MTAKSVSEIRQTFQKQGIEALQHTADNQVKAILEHADPKQPEVGNGEAYEDITRADGWEAWDGSLFNLEDMSKAFDREAIEQDFLKVIDPAAPGTSGDLMAISLQGDWMATMERAFRSRHSTPVRAWFHALGRRRGHAHVNGTLQKGLLRHVESVLQASKNQQVVS